MVRLALTKVTGAGLKEVAGLKSLQSLNVAFTGMTSATVVAEVSHHYRATEWQIKARRWRPPWPPPEGKPERVEPG